MCLLVDHSEVLEYFLLIFGWTDKDSSSLTISFKTHYFTICFATESYSILVLSSFLVWGGGGSSRIVLY